MENQNNFQAIIAFLQSLNLSNYPISIEDLTDGCTFLEILQMVEEFSVGQQKFTHATNWPKAMTNNKTLLKYLKKLYEQFFLKYMPTHQIDLVRLCKNKDKEQISKLFFMILSTIVQSSEKEFFISKLLNLSSSHQAYFMQKIQYALAETEGEQSKQTKEFALLETVNELQRQNDQLQVQLNTLSQQADTYKRSLKQFQSKLQASAHQIDTLRNQNEHLEKQQGKKSNPRDLKIIQNMKEKMKTLVREHTKEVEKYKQQLMILESQTYKIIELQNIAETYKENYNQAVEHLKQMGQWEQDKNRMSKQIQRANQIIEDQEESITEFNLKIQSLNDEILDLQISNQRLTVRNSQLQEVKSRNSAHRMSVDYSKIGNPRTLSQIIPNANQQNQNQNLYKQLQRKNNKIQMFEKQIQKLRFRAERVGQIEKEKERLEALIMEQHQSKLDEIELLTTCMYDLRLKYKALLEHKTN